MKTIKINDLTFAILKQRLTDYVPPTPVDTEITLKGQAYDFATKKIQQKAKAYKITIPAEDPEKNKKEEWISNAPAKARTFDDVIRQLIQIAEEC